MSIATHSLEGWHARATALQSSSSSLPSMEDFAMAVTCSSMVRPRELILALFQPDIAIDGRGRTLRLSPEDFSAFLALAPKESKDWRVYSAVTCRPCFGVLTPAGRSSVYNWNLRTRELDGGGELPEDVWSLFKVAQETEGEGESERLGDGDKAKVTAVMDLLGV